MAKLRHLAILTHQPEKMAQFYTSMFDMHELCRTKSGSIHLSDGEVNLAVLNANNPREPGHPTGLSCRGWRTHGTKTPIFVI